MNFTVSAHLYQGFESGLLVFNRDSNSVHFLEEQAANFFRQATKESCTIALRARLSELSDKEFEIILKELSEAGLLRLERESFSRRNFLAKGGFAATALIVSTALPASAASGPVVPTVTCGNNCMNAGCAPGEQVCIYDENDPAFCTQSDVDGCCGIFGVTFSLVCTPPGPCPPADGNNNFNSVVSCP